MFHTQMDFLEKTVKKFMKASSSRDPGTLSNIKIHIQRSSVNGNVKSRFKAHHEFILLCGTAYVIEAAMEYFAMESMSSPPSKHVPPPNIKNTHVTRRKAVFDETMDGFLETLTGPLSVEEVESPSVVNILIAGQQVSVPVRDGIVSMQIQQGSTIVHVKTPLNTLKKQDLTIKISEERTIDVQLKKADELRNYALNFIQYFLVLLNFKDAVREGDIFRVNNILKLMIPFFYKHSHLSKYLAECVDYILKTEVLLPARYGLKVRVASFVNPKGKIGKNKSADLQKENQVKELKEAIKGLGANKTEELIVRVSKTGQVVDRIVEQIDMELGHKDIKTTHKPRSEKDDFQAVLNLLRQLRPFLLKPGRLVSGYEGIKSSVFCELQPVNLQLQNSIMNTANRLKRGLIIVDQDEEENFNENIHHEEVVETCNV